MILSSSASASDVVSQFKPALSRLEMKAVRWLQLTHVDGHALDGPTGEREESEASQSNRYAVE